MQTTTDQARGVIELMKQTATAMEKAWLGVMDPLIETAQEIMTLKERIARLEKAVDDQERAA